MSERSLITPITLPPRRTRTNVIQSRNGCYTCKARRLKCDETHPFCLRCQRAGKKCLGYPDQLSGHQSQLRNKDEVAGVAIFKYSRNFQNSTLSFCHKVLHGLPISAKESSYSSLGLETLLQNRHNSGLWACSSEWLQLLSHSLPTSNALLKAVVCFGSACEALLLPAASRHSLQLVQWNQQALVALQQEISSGSKDPIPMFLASIVLAAAAVLMRHLPAALTHIRGAQKSLTILSQSPSSSPEPTNGARPSKLTLDYEQLLNDLALSMDMHTAWYRLSYPPELPQSIDLRQPPEAIYDMLENSGNIALLLHDCYHFASRASEFKYSSTADTPSALVEEQSRYIALLAHCLQARSEKIKLKSDEIETESFAALVQQVQCLSTFIYLSTILQPYESAYDTYEPQFLQILSISEELLAHRHKSFLTSSLPQFQLQPGIFQPLYITAMKYRHRGHRRRAIDLFCQIGLEGPWSAKIMSGVALRAIEIEEATLDIQNIKFLNAECVPEAQRIHGCGHNSPPVDVHHLPILIETNFSQCIDIEGMLRLPGPKHTSHWRHWTELIEIADYV